VIDPNSDGVSEMASPFFYDFVVPSDDSGYMSFIGTSFKLSLQDMFAKEKAEVGDRLASRWKPRTGTIIESLCVGITPRKTQLRVIGWPKIIAFHIICILL
jgi:hypothetical protein